MRRIYINTERNVRNQWRFQCLFCFLSHTQQDYFVLFSRAFGRCNLGSGLVIECVDMKKQNFSGISEQYICFLCFIIYTFYNNMSGQIKVNEQLTELNLFLCKIRAIAFVCLAQWSLVTQAASHVTPPGRHGITWLKAITYIWHFFVCEQKNVTRLSWGSPVGRCMHCCNFMIAWQGRQLSIGVVFCKTNIIYI